VQLLRVGQRDAPERHRTLWETLEWSYRLLSDRNKSVFRRCALFAASWSIPAAEAVSTRWDGDTSEEAATLQIMGALSDQSLIYPVEGASGEPRFAMLETVRAFARDCLDGANETDEVLTRLIAWGITYAGDARRASFGADQGQWFARLDDERVILRSAANSAIDRGDAVAALRLAGALTRFWWVRGHHPEDREWLERALSYDQAAPREAAAPPDVRALALLALGNFSFERGDLSEAAAAYENSIAIARAAKAHDDLGFGLLNLGMIAAQRGDLNRSWATFQEAIDVLEERGNHQRHAMVLTIFGGILALSGEPDRAATMLDQALGIHLSLNDTRMVIFTLNSLGDVARLRGHMSEAKRLYSQGHSLGKDLGERRGVATSLAGLGWLAIDMAAPADASTNMARSLALRVEIGDRLGQADCATGLAAAIVHTAPDQSARLLGAATTLRTAIGAIPLPVIGDAVNHITEAGRHLLGDEAFRQQVALGATHSAVDVLFDAYQTLSSSADSNTASLLTPASLPEPAVTAGNRRVAEPVGACGGETIASGSTAPRKTLPALSRREREVLALIVAGHQDREIAEALFLSPRTVSWHVTNIFNKLDVNSRVAAAVLAIRDGLVDNPRVTAQTHHSAPPNKVTWEWPSAS
jgi:non-specific serine/threonine protein kinase